MSNTLLTISITDVALQGTLPATFGTVDRPLNSIELQMNDLTGTIPSNIGTIHTTLSYLDLSDNMLSGSVPSTLCISVLDTLKISGNSALDCYEDCLSTVSTQEYGSIPQCSGMNRHINKCVLSLHY